MLNVVSKTKSPDRTSASFFKIKQNIFLDALIQKTNFLDNANN